MKKFVIIISIFFIGIGVFSNSCNKHDNQLRLDFAIDTIQTIYVPNHGSYHKFLKASFLSGSPTENITLQFSNMPSKVTVSPSTYSAVPTYTADFLFSGGNQAIGIYPIIITATSPSVGTKNYPVNIVVTQNNCALVLAGNYLEKNTCSSGNNYTNPATVTATGNYSININNFGGYGLSTNTSVQVNCNVDSLYIPNQNIGNGITMSGAGIFSANQLIITYTAHNVPAGFPENCTDTLTMQ